MNLHIIYETGCATSKYCIINFKFDRMRWPTTIALKFPALPGSLSIFVMLPFSNSPTKPLLAFIGFFNGFGELKKLLDHLRSKLASIT